MVFEKCTKSKQKNINHNELKMQHYLTDPSTSKEQKLLLFKWRTRNHRGFEDNIRGGKVETYCPLCNNHPDSQEDYFLNCPYLRQRIDVEGNYFQLFYEDIPKTLVDTLTKISRVRD